MDDKPVTDLKDMAGSTDVEVETPTPAHDCDTPNRAIRRLFVFISMFLAWVTGLVLVKFGGEGKIAILVADSMMTYVITMGITYIVGHSVDRSEILGKVFRRRKTDEEGPP